MYRRCTPTVRVLFFRSPVSSTGLVHHEHGLVVGQVVDHVGLQVVADRVGVPPRAGEQEPQACGVASAACSAIVQQFLRGRSASRSSTNCPARKRGRPGRTDRRSGPPGPRTPPANGMHYAAPEATANSSVFTFR